MKTKSDSTPLPASPRTLDSVLSAIVKQFGEGSILRLDSTQFPPIESLSTGSFAADLALGVGGLPRGRIAEVFGPESSGKTTFCLSLIAEAQRQGGNAAIIDVEHALDPKWARTCGVDTGRLLISQPDTGEDALTIAEYLITSGAVDVVVIDSVAALTPRQEMEGVIGDVAVGALARLMSQAMRRLTGAIAKTKCVCLFVNQVRERIGVVYGNSEYQPGGRALKFFSTVRIDLRRKEVLKNPEGVAIGNRVRLKVVKNKVAAPYTECEFDIDFDCGLSNAGSLLDLGLEHKLVEKKGSWFGRNGTLWAQGREGAKAHLRYHPEVAAELSVALRSLSLSQQGAHKTTDKAA